MVPRPRVVSVGLNSFLCFSSQSQIFDEVCTVELRASERFGANRCSLFAALPSEHRPRSSTMIYPRGGAL